MAEVPNSISNTVIRQIIKKSLFTERQIAIILNKLGMEKLPLSITKGAYYRQVGQSREKLAGLYYSIILLRGLNIIREEDLDVINRLSEQVSVIKNSDVFPERVDDVMSVIQTLIIRACRL